MTGDTGRRSGSPRKTVRQNGIALRPANDSRKQLSGPQSGGVRFAEITTQGEAKTFVNPATVAYLQVVEDGGSIGFSA